MRRRVSYPFIVPVLLLGFAGMVAKIDEWRQTKRQRVQRLAKPPFSDLRPLHGLVTMDSHDFPRVRTSPSASIGGSSMMANFFLRANPLLAGERPARKRSIIQNPKRRSRTSVPSAICPSAATRPSCKAHRARCSHSHSSF